jgi:hypothetical protein
MTLAGLFAELLLSREMAENSTWNKMLVPRRGGMNGRDRATRLAAQACHEELGRNSVASGASEPLIVTVLGPKLQSAPVRPVQTMMAKSHPPPIRYCRPHPPR